MPPLRSFLFAPGNHPRRVEKALTLDADAVILDLEDAVAVAEKRATRAAVAAALGRPRTGLLYVRVNALDTEFCYGDLDAMVRPGPAAPTPPSPPRSAGRAPGCSMCGSTPSIPSSATATWSRWCGPGSTG